MYWSQTESSKWSLDCLSHDLGHPFTVRANDNTKKPGKTCSCRLRTRVKHPAAALTAQAFPVTCPSAS
eukprot:scaffold25961_cov63-Phaeocystis_antarctica.AAC.4